MHHRSVVTKQEGCEHPESASSLSIECQLIHDSNGTTTATHNPLLHKEEGYKRVLLLI